MAPSGLLCLTLLSGCAHFREDVEEVPVEPEPQVAERPVPAPSDPRNARPVPRPVTPPPPSVLFMSVSARPRGLEGLSPAELEALFGAPDERVEEGAALVWRWRGESCTLETQLFQVLETGALRVLQYRAEGVPGTNGSDGAPLAPPKLQGDAEAACFRELHRGHLMEREIVG